MERMHSCGRILSLCFVNVYAAWKVAVTGMTEELIHKSMPFPSAARSAFLVIQRDKRHTVV